MNFEIGDVSAADRQKIMAVTKAAAAALGRVPAMVVVVDYDGRCLQTLLTHEHPPQQLAAVCNELAKTFITRAEALRVIDRARDSAAGAGGG